MIKHALLSASSCKQWLHCPPSAKLCADVKEEASPYAQEGTDAHRLCEYKILHALGQKIRDPTEDLEYYDTEMEDCATAYCSYVLDQYKEVHAHCPDPLILIEEKLDFSRWVPEGFGTGDAVLVSDDVLHIIDFKYGRGVLVKAAQNPQMMCYALGALDLYDGLYSINTVEMTIFQPRRDNISSYTMRKEEILQWADEILAPTAQLAYDGQGDFKAGDHCRFCKIRTACRTYAEYTPNTAKEDFEGE